MIHSSEQTRIVVPVHSWLYFEQEALQRKYVQSNESKSSVAKMAKEPYSKHGWRSVFEAAKKAFPYAITNPRRLG